MISQELVEALNEQIGQELQASQMYLGMGAYLREKNWDGFAEFVEDQAEHEREHAMKIYGFLDDVDARIEIPGTEAPTKDFDNVIAVFETALEAEQNNTEAFRQIQEIADRNDDYHAQTLLDWFHDEQVEEENHIQKILIQIRRLGGDARFLFAVDQELAGGLNDE